MGDRQPHPDWPRPGSGSCRSRICIGEHVCYAASTGWWCVAHITEPEIALVGSWKSLTAFTPTNWEVYTAAMLAAEDALVELGEEVPRA